ncbi:MAG: SDR family oxidoreductase [Pedobacter sp.]|nr:MAG: SDR family oxidoreductase [Pedobacter sp.]
MRLKNKVAVITGGNSGIGYGIAKEFAAEGAIGAIVGRNEDTLKSSVAGLDDQFIGIKCDVTQLDELANMFTEAAQKFGKLDILIVNAGGAIGAGTAGNMADVTEDDFDKIMNLNLKSVFFTVQKALPHLKDGASVVLVGSLTAHKPLDGLTTYGGAKAAVVNWARSFSKDLVDRKIRVNILSPGTIDTPVFERLGIPHDIAMELKKDVGTANLIQRIGLPSEMGKVAVFLGSDDSSFVIGQEIVADGGVYHF